MTADRFLSRWMRRKAAARQAEAVRPTAPAPGPAKGAEAPPAVPVAPPDSAAATPRAPQPPIQTELPTLDSLQGLVSEYRDFMNVGVDPNVQRAALKKLFADPHFNIMDGLDVYIDDYGIPDPIPPAMLASLNQAQSLLFREPEVESVGAPETEQTPEPDTIAMVDESDEVDEAVETDDAVEPATPAVQFESEPVVADSKGATVPASLGKELLPESGEGGADH